ncbi:MAG: helix-turn-helix domain-containing protein [Actinomycetota bacterium]
MTVSERLLRIPEVARRLKMDGGDVFLLIRSGELYAGKGKDGLVYVPEESLRDYERHHPIRATRTEEHLPPPQRPREIREGLLRVPEVARRLDMDGGDVYLLIRSGELYAGKGKDGLVYVPEEALREFEQRQSETSR